MKSLFFRRNKKPQREYRKVAYIVCEGATEREYFKKLKTLGPGYVIEVIDNRKASDVGSLLRLIGKKVLAKGDIAAIVIDKDNRSLSDLAPLIAWQEPGRKFLCLSAPQFEYWLTLHKREGSGITTQRDCERAILAVFPGYKKPKVPNDVFNLTALATAIQRAKIDKVPEVIGNELPLKGTNLYALLEKIFGL